MLKRLGSKTRLFLVHQTTSIIQKAHMISLWLFTFLKACIETNKNSKHYFLKH